MWEDDKFLFDKEFQALVEKGRSGTKNSLKIMGIILVLAALFAVAQQELWLKKDMTVYGGTIYMVSMLFLGCFFLFYFQVSSLFQLQEFNMRLCRIENLLSKSKPPEDD